VSKAKKVTWKPTKVSAEAHVQVRLDFTCPLCDTQQGVVLTNAHIVGGCMGHPEGDYCYCNAPHYEETVKCSQCDVTVELQTGYY
jgi:hypothetical protein